MLPNPAFSEEILIDHTCRELGLIPDSAIIKAKEILHIAYGHQSHGTGLYDHNVGGSNGALYDNGSWNVITGATTPGNPNQIAFADASRDYIAAHPQNQCDNVVMVR